MSAQQQKLTCQACHAYLFEEDDVVYCPDCGAPHHRECYLSAGHCALEDKHGTEEQYDFSKNSEVITPDSSNGDGIPKVKCQMCGEFYNADEVSCPNCNVPNGRNFGRVNMTFDYLGGVPADLDLGDGVTADEAKRFVFANTHRYIPKFAANKLGKKASFNWIAFFFPNAWFLSRKMYKAGIITTVLDVALSLLVIPFETVMNSFLPENMSSYEQMLEAIERNIGKIGIPAVITAAAGLIGLLIYRIICGVFGDYIYRNHCISTVKKIKAESEDQDEDYRKLGGVNILLFVVGVFGTDILFQIISMFLT